jgi:demethylspheroidene O-methyltransferase
MSGTPGAEPMGDAYFAFYLLAMGKGKSRSVERLSEMLVEAGFASVRLESTRLPLQVRMLVAVRP